MVGSRAVLVIEPADDDRGSFADTLRHTGILVDSIAEPARARAAIASGEYAIAVIDSATLGFTSAMLAEALKVTPARPVVLVIADPGETYGFGADVIHGYLRRSSDRERLAELIADCLAALRDVRRSLDSASRLPLAEL